MSSASVADLCDCPNDCNSNYYTYSMSAIKLDTEAVCHKEEEALSENVSLSNYPNFMRSFESLVFKVDTGKPEICARTLKNMVFLEFQLAGENIVQFKRDLRVTFADQIANLGMFPTFKIYFQVLKIWFSCRGHRRPLHWHEHPELL